MESAALLVIASVPLVYVAIVALKWLLGGRGYRKSLGEPNLRTLAYAYASRAGWERYRQLVLDGILSTALVSPLPLRRIAVGCHTALQRDMGDYRVANVRLETAPGVFLGANVYEPGGDAATRRPAILCPHGHFERGRFGENVQMRCATLARMGAIVIAYDMVGYGDSPLKHKGVPGVLGVQLFNSIRVVDYLTKRKDVDHDRIGVTGASGGGTQTILLTAVDPRIKASVPCVMVASDFFGGCACESGLPIHRSAAYQTNNVMIAALAAPRPQLVISCGNDWTRHCPTRDFPVLQSIYSLYDVRDRVSNAHFPSEHHDYGPNKRAAMYSFFIEHFALAPVPPESTLSLLTPSDLSAFSHSDSLSASQSVSEARLYPACMKVLKDPH